MEDLPIFEASIDKEYQKGENELGMDEIAFTSDPAVMVKGVAFKSDKKELFADAKKYRITAPAMIPMDIYRNDEDGEYELRFTEETIEKIHSKFMSNLKNQDLFNVEHFSDERAPAYILEAWIVDKPREDKAYSTFGIEVPKGTLMLTAQITDKEFYNDIVENERFGFSIEAFLALAEPQTSKQINNSNMLPDGTFELDGKKYEVKDGVITFVESEEEEVIVSEKMSEETTTEVVMAEEPTAEVEMENEEETKEEQMEEPKEEEMAIDPAADSEAILAIVAPYVEEKMAEVLSLIAELKEEMGESVEDAATEDAEVEMTASHKFHNLVKFLQNG